ncbi:MAG TPA: transposase [Terrimicrobiaceae bacterium]|nr:transposase [Terrimicrobiaceae bacterium]
MFSKRQGEEKQEEFWIERGRVSKPSSQGFYGKLKEHLAAMDFARQVWALCGPAYREESRGGRPGIDPVVYFKMLMVGFFENLRSERAIAARCEDSLGAGVSGIRLEESTPDHSSLSVIRHRLGPEIYQRVFEAVLLALKAHGLLKGRHLGIDSSVIEANASLRTLVHRNTEQAYWEYVKELAEKEGIDPQDEGAVRSFDKKRPGRKTSNQEWKNPHDPQAKVGRTKDGACDMIYKPEHVTDLESGAIVQAEVLEGDHADTRALSERVACAVEVVNRIVANQEDAVVRSLAADKGYFAVEEIAQIQEFDIRTVIGDAHCARRRKQGLAAPLRKALDRAARAVKSQSGKALLRQRGMHLERSCEHVLDEGGMRRATLRGEENLTKRHKIAAACFNLSLLLPTLLGVGTQKQWIASTRRLLQAVIACLYGQALRFRNSLARTRNIILPNLFRIPTTA